MKRRPAFTAVAFFFVLSAVSNLFAAQRDRVDDIDVPLRNWSVPSAEPLRIGTNAAISSNTSFIAVVPCRAVDTRGINPGALGGGIMADNSTRSFALNTATNCDAIPISVKAYSVNIAVFGSAPGPTDDFLMAYPTGSPQPNVANLNFVGGQTLSNAAIVPAGTNASIDIYVYRSTHVIIDVNGYFIEPVVTGITAGAGLNADNGSGNVTLSIAPLGVVASMLAASAVTTGAIQDGAATDAKVGTLTSSGKVANSATTATPTNVANTIVARDGAGGFAAGALTLSGKVDQTSVDGLVARGTFGSGTIPATGGGTRMMWYPGKAAFRAGYVNGTQWDDASVGNYSNALGYLSIASGLGSTALGSSSFASAAYATAMGESTIASGSTATAMGQATHASGYGSTAMGQSTTASGNYSTAMGYLTTASGALSTVMGGYASTNGHAGAFVFGDSSTTFAVVNASADNQFVVRAAGGTIFWSNSATSLGVSLGPNGTSWASVSDRNRKEDFRDIDGEEILHKLAALPVTSWRYKGDDSRQRYIGPMAQDFHALFGLGTDTTIATLDIEGVTLAAVKALRDQVERLTRRIDQLEAQLAAKQ